MSKVEKVGRAGQDVDYSSAVKEEKTIEPTELADGYLTGQPKNLAAAPFEKPSVFGLSQDSTSPRGSKGNPIKLIPPDGSQSFNLPESAYKLTQEHAGVLDKLVIAIATQDREFHRPDGSTISCVDETAKLRWYESDGNKFTLRKIADWVRISRGYVVKDTAGMSYTEITLGWKKRLFHLDDTGAAGKTAKKDKAKPNPARLISSIKQAVGDAAQLQGKGDRVAKLLRNLDAAGFVRARSENIRGALEDYDFDGSLLEAFDVPALTSYRVDSPDVLVDVAIGSELKKLEDMIYFLLPTVHVIPNTLDNPAVWKSVNKFLNASPRDPKTFLAEAEAKIAVVREINQQLEKGASPTYPMLDKFRSAFGWTSEYKDSKLRNDVIEVNTSAMAWVMVFEALKIAVKSEGDTARGNWLSKSAERIEALIEMYDSRSPQKFHPVTGSLKQLGALLSGRKKVLQKAARIVVEDTSNIAEMMRAIDAFPEIVGGLNIAGEKNAALSAILLLAGPDQRVLLAKDGSTGQLLSAAVLKMRRSKSGKSIVHMERPAGQYGILLEPLMQHHLVATKLKNIGSGTESKVFATRPVYTSADRMKAGTLFARGGREGMSEYSSDAHRFAPTPFQHSAVPLAAANMKFPLGVSLINHVMPAKLL